MTSEQAERLKGRLRAASSLRAIYEVLADLRQLEAQSREPRLALFVVSSVLQAFAWRLEGITPRESDDVEHGITGVWARFQQLLVPAMVRALDEYEDGSESGLFRELNMLAGQWRMLADELT